MFNPNPYCGGVRRWGFREDIRHQGGAPGNGISALTKETPCPLYPVRTQQEDTHCAPGNVFSLDTKSLPVDFQPLEPWDIKSHPAV